MLKQNCLRRLFHFFLYHYWNKKTDENNQYVYIRLAPLQSTLSSCLFLTFSAVLSLRWPWIWGASQWWLSWSEAENWFVVPGFPNMLVKNKILFLCFTEKAKVLHSGLGIDINVCCLLFFFSETTCFYFFCLVLLSKNMFLKSTIIFL